MNVEAIKDAENDVHEILSEYGLVGEDLIDCAGRLINLLTDAIEQVIENEDEMARVRDVMRLDSAKAK
jgi:hypothetical protein